MSLDVYLRHGTKTKATGSGIFVRESGQTKEISRAEWDEKFPNCEPVVAAVDSDDLEGYSANITHNLNAMAGEAGIYEALWRPNENGITEAWQLIALLRSGLELLRSDRPRFEKFNPANGWGDYDGLVSFVAEYLAVCEQDPEAEVSVSR